MSRGASGVKKLSKLGQILADPQQRGRVTMWIVVIVGAAFSFRSIMDVAISLGIAEGYWTAAAIPIVIDGVVFYATDTAWVRAKEVDTAWLPFAFIAFAFNALSAVANGVAHDGDRLTHLIGGIVPVAVQIALLIGGVESRRYANLSRAKPLRVQPQVEEPEDLPIITAQVERDDPPAGSGESDLDEPLELPSVPRLRAVGSGDRKSAERPAEQISSGQEPTQGEDGSGDGQVGKAWPAEIKQRVLDRVRAGESPAKVAREEGFKANRYLSPATVKTWKRLEKAKFDKAAER